MFSYSPNHLETIVYELLTNLDIHSLNQINLEFIAKTLGVKFRYAPINSITHIEKKLIIVDNRLSVPEQREDFAHELCHVLAHSGSQNIFPELFITLQESQANKMAMHLLIPHHMLIDRLELGIYRPDDLADQFRVTTKLIQKRLQMLETRMHNVRAQIEFAVSLEKMPKLGRDYDHVTTIGRTELYYKKGRLIGDRTTY